MATSETKKAKQDMATENNENTKTAGEATDSKAQENEAKAGCQGKKECRKESKAVKKDKERLEELEKSVEELNGKIAREKDDYIRLMAEFDNYRRRTSQEKIDLISSASEETIKGLLPILDDCERALEVLRKSDDSNAAKEGTELIYNKLMGYLKTKGLAVIEAKGIEFNTDVHEAVAQFPVQDEEAKGKVFDVVQTGYTLNGKVIRFAKVVVAI